MHGQHITYLLPEELFEPSIDIQTYTADRIQREINHDPELSRITVEVEDQNLGDLVTLATRRGMWIPNQYAALVLEDNLTPAQVRGRIYGQILRDGTTNVCKPLIHYLQVQMLGMVALNAAMFDTDSELVPPRASPLLMRHRGKVLSHLISPASAGVASGVATAPITTANFQDIIDAMRLSQVVPPTAPSASTTSTRIEKRWSVNLNTLLLFNLANQVSDLPPIYGAIADGTRKQERATLQAGYNDIARSPGAVTRAPLVITKELATTLFL